VTSDERQQLRDAATAALSATRVRGDHPRPFADVWQLQTSNSFRRVGTSLGDGDVLCATRHPIDGHPDLLAAPAVLDYIVSAQPRVVLALLDYLDGIELRLDAARALGDKIALVERKLASVAGVVAAVGAAAATLSDPAADPTAVAEARLLVEQLASLLRAGADA
jgi:hypothetical protein